MQLLAAFAMALVDQILHQSRCSGARHKCCNRKFFFLLFVSSFRPYDYHYFFPVFYPFLYKNFSCPIELWALYLILILNRNSCSLDISLLQLLGIAPCLCFFYAYILLICPKSLELIHLSGVTSFGSGTLNMWFWNMGHGLTGKYNM